MSQAPLPAPARPPLPAGNLGPSHGGAAPRQGGMTRGTKWLVGCLVGGCGVVVLVMVVAFVVGGMALLQNFSLSTKAAVPTDFPVYPRAVQQAGFTLKSKDGNPGHGVAFVQWQIPGRAGPVSAWYRDQLNRGDWEVVSSEDALGRTRFRRKSTGAVASLQIRDQLAQTIVQLAMTDDQPLARGAHAAPTEAPAPDVSP